MDNDEITTQNIQPYVAIGPPGASITVHKSTFDTAFILFTLLVGGILLTVAILTIYFASVNARLPPPPPPLFPNQQLTIHNNIGAATHPSSLMSISDATELTTRHQCDTLPNTTWINGECQCKPPFFGPICSRERHDTHYYGVGIPNESTLQMTIIEQIKSNGKSFNQDSCSDHCDRHDKCNSFIYHPFGICTLLTNDIIIPRGDGLPYDNDSDSTLYMRSSDNLHFEGRIFLGRYTFSLPPRYWLVRKSDGYIQLIANMISTIDFIPTYLKIYGNYTGIYCTHEFSNEDVDIIIARGENSECYVHRSGNDLSLPADWKYRLPLYVVYF